VMKHRDTDPPVKTPGVTEPLVFHVVGGVAWRPLKPFLSAFSL